MRTQPRVDWGTHAEVAMPFRDVSLLSLALRLPQEEFMIGGRERGIARSIVEGLGVGRVAKHPDRGPFAPGYPQAVRRQAAAVRDYLSGFDVADALGAIDLEAVTSLLEEVLELPDHLLARDQGALQALPIAVNVLRFVERAEEPRAAP